MPFCCLKLPLSSNLVTCTNISCIEFIIQADSRGPEFESKFKKTELEVDVSFTTLELLLHQESLMRVIKYIVRIQQILQVR